MSRGKRGSRIGFLVGFLLVALLVAGVGSYYASSHPDGLNQVARQAGFASHEKKSVAAHGPMAGYRTHGVDDPRLSRGIAGVSGALLVLALGGGLFRVLRRRPTEDS